MVYNRGTLGVAFIVKTVGLSADASPGGMRPDGMEAERL